MSDFLSYKRKIIKLTSNFIAFIAFLSIFTTVPGYAQATVSGSVTVTAGSLTVTSSSGSMNFTCSGGCVVSNANQSATGSVTGTFQDLRGSGAGYSSVAYVKNFANGSYILPICTTTTCTTSRLSVTGSAIAVASGEPAGVATTGSTDNTSAQNVSALNNLSSTGDNSASPFSLFSFSGAGVCKVQVTNGGSGYSTAPTVTIAAPGAGTTATATATITSNAVSAINITGIGSGYSSASPPTISFSGGGGTGAAAVSVVGCGEGKYDKPLSFSLTLPPYTRAGTLTSQLVIQSS